MDLGALWSLGQGYSLPAATLCCSAGRESPALGSRSIPRNPPENPVHRCAINTINDAWYCCKLPHALRTELTSEKDYPGVVDAHQVERFSSAGRRESLSYPRTTPA